MGKSRSHKHVSTSAVARQAIKDIAQEIWGKPQEACPKCKSEQTDYYDPFFFAPLRTLSGKRRIKCQHCGFIWRPSRSKHSFLSKFSPTL